MDFQVHYAYAPTQADVDQMEHIIQGAHRIVCDATEGQLGFGTVWLTSGAGGKSRADVWIMPPGMWQRSTNKGFILEDNSRIFLMPGGRTMYTFAHEMAHALFRLRDEYGEQNRWGRYDGFGFAIEPGFCSITGDRCWTSANCDAEETCNHSQSSPITLTDQIHSMMGKRYLGSWPNQKVPHECVNRDQPTQSSLDPCRSDYDCPQGEVCPPHEFYSEFLKAEHFDELPGNGLVCPEDRPGKTISLIGLLGATAADEVQDGADPFVATTWAQANDTATYVRTLDFIDEAGIVTRAGQKSHHEIGVYFKHIDRSARLWEVHFLIATNRLDGENPMDTGPTVLKSQYIDFNGGSTTYEPLNVSAYEAQLCNPSAGFCDLNPVAIPDLENTEAPWSLELDVSEFVLHDGGSWRTKHSVILADGDVAQRGNCQASGRNDPCSNCTYSFCDVCANVYNTNTDRWESSSMWIAALMENEDPKRPYYDSEWHQIADSPNRHPPCDAVGNPECPDPDPDAFHGELIIPAGHPKADPHEKCWEPIEIVTTVEGSDAIVFVIDVSGSMNKDFASGGETAPRIEWAKGAARALSDLVAQHNDAVGADEKQMLGLVSFSNGAKEELPLEEVDSSNLGDLMLVIDDLSAGGYTALADGIMEGFFTVQGASHTPANPALVVMTDGYANVCWGDGESCEVSMGCDCQSDPSAHAKAAVEAVDDAGVTVYFTPLGAEHGQGVFGEAVEEASGEVFPAPEPWDLGMQYARSYLRISGISPIVDALPWVAGGGTQGQPFWFDFPVEESAGTLTLLLTASNLDVESWDPGWTIMTPSALYDEGAPGPVAVYDDPSGSFYRILRIDAPEAGTYHVGLSSKGGVAQHGSVMAWTDSPEPGCWVAAERTVVYDDGQDLEILVSATYEGPLEEVEYEAVVVRPDGSDPVPIVLTEDEDEPGMARGVFPASEFHGRGQYLVVATCEASNAWFHPGESLDDEDEPLPAVRAPEFLRAGSTSFFLEIPEYGWLPPGGDCDGNGIPDECEGASCIDGWGSCEGEAVPCHNYSSQRSCDPQPGCTWFCGTSCFCRGNRSCGQLSSAQDCASADGCDWDVPYPCPPDPTSLDTNGNGILDACDPDNTGSDVPDRWEPPWCAEMSEPCTSMLCGVTVECCPGLTCGSAGYCEEPCSDMGEPCEDHGDCCDSLQCNFANNECSIPV